ncbi:MAG: HIT domain-containing protein [Candidatus Doudnabacteria bacterium]|nr:HIT domain-containing protein [Candidatus Doudnabacteria bacterium]
MKCPFCNLGEMQGRVIFKNDLVFVIPTNIPIVPGHVLVCPLRHVQKIEELTPEEHKALFLAAEKIKQALENVFQAEGYNFAWNEGGVAGQSVPHFHLHILPRKAGDTGITEYEPRKFLYRPGSREASPDSELEEVTKIIKQYMD